MKRLIPILLACLTLPACTHAPSSKELADAPPPAPREFRGTWVASVNNANWPSRAGLTVAQQKQEIIDTLDRAAALKLNAVVFQVRPCADALYKSDLEPWSEYLTGVQGQPPTPFYDPLQMWIDEAHKRGIELHAWFNPYRVKHTSSKSNIAGNSIARTHPEIVKQYGGYLWMDPGEPRAAQQTINVILDIVRRYDIDGIHTDDYYYPYKLSDGDKNPIEFPDEQSYARYKQTGGKLSRDDWRRDNINRLVNRIYIETKKIKPWVKVGYGPFGIWKSGVPAGIKGMSQYDELYADAKLWFNKGWLDYISPQLYWKIGGPQSYPVLLNWWISQNTQKRHLWPGLSVGRHPVQEVLNQIDLTRRSRGGMGGGATGNLHWSSEALLNSNELVEALEKGPYATSALIPASPWLDNTAPAAPSVSATLKGNVVTATLKAAPVTSRAGKPVAVFAVYARYGKVWRFTVVPGRSSGVTLNPDATGKAADAVVVSAVDRVGNESPRTAVMVSK